MKEAFWRTLLTDRYWDKAVTENRVDNIKRLPKTLLITDIDWYFGGEGDGPEHFPPENQSDEEKFRTYLLREHIEYSLYSGVFLP